MNLGFWSQLRGGTILCLAPMADVTDSSFRFVISKHSDIPHVTWTEFVSADGLRLAPEVGRQKLLKDLEYGEMERPIIAQFFTSNPESMRYAGKLALELGFDGVDINMGCPDKSIEKQGAGAALIKTPKLARELIRAAREGSEGKLPVSVKTRLGYNTDQLEEWLPELLAENPAVITIHARTRKEMSKVPARWERVKRAVEIRNSIQAPSLALPRRGRASENPFPLERGRGEADYTLIFGNGDVESLEDAYRKEEETGCDGVMLGRAIFGNPFLFSTHTPTIQEKLEALVEHTRAFEEKLGSVKSFAIMKKHFKAYVKDFDHSHDLRQRLMECESSAQVESIISSFLLE